MHSETAALVALLHERPDGLSWPDVAVEVSLLGSAMKLWRQLEESSAPSLFGSATPRDPLQDASTEVASWKSASFDVTTVLDDRYPARLRQIRELPPILFSRGLLMPDEDAVSVVGSRQASSAGLQFAGEVARGLVDRKLTVLSGLAAGIDSAAHTATIEYGGRPVGVIGTGIERTYPTGSRDLHQAVAQNGALISQFWPLSAPTRWSFPRCRLLPGALPVPGPFGNSPVSQRYSQAPKGVLCSKI